MAKKGGGGGSQLSQLKNRLRDEGVSDRRQMKASAKKRKRGQAGSEKDEMADRREKLSRIASSATFNPFEEKVTKPKNAVLGRKIKGAIGRPGMAKMGGLQERQERLLPEYLARNKSGSFIDRRFGEDGSSGTSLEEKMLERFTKERQSRVGKGSLYNLDDGEEEGLTHYGKSLNDLDDYDDIHLSDEEEESGLQEEGAHFGGFKEDADGEVNGDDNDRKRSKAEVMREVMAKSKLAKYERQKTKMADEDIREELDNELGDLRSLLFAQQKEDSHIFEEPVAKRPLFGDGSKKDAYDAAVREMAFERRAKPQDRLKTEAEKAEDLAEKLRKAEENRLKRMRGEEPEDDSNLRKNSKSKGGGDDLEDDFELDGMTSRDVYGLGSGLTVEGDAQTASDEEDDNDDQDKEDLEESSEEEEDNFEDLADPQALAQTGEDNEVDSDSEQALTATATARPKKVNQGAREALPFTFPCPSTHEELLDILGTNEVVISQVPLVLKRIRALYHPSLAEDNKFKLQAFLGVLLDHIVYVANSLGSGEQDNAATLDLIDSIVSQIFSLSKVYPLVAAEHFNVKLALMQRNLTRGLNKGPLSLDSKTWPGVTECILLKITSTIWPTSDRTHPVATPLSILISQYLSGGRVRSLKDVASGLFLCCIVYDNEKQSKRLQPEALNFLHNAITLLAPVNSIKALRQINNSYGIPWPDFGLVSSKEVRIVSNLAPMDKVNFFAIFTEDSKIDEEESKSSLLLGALQLIADFAHLYTGSIAFVELFHPFQQMLENLTNLHHNFQKKQLEIIDLLSRLLTNAKSQRRYLRLQAHRAIGIASHIPKFDQGFNPERKGGRTFDPDAERAEQSKLRALLKKERKGAIRELRRDNDFLTNEKRKEREEEDQRYKKTIDKIVGSLSTERGEQKKYLQDKQRLKKRSGKK